MIRVTVKPYFHLREALGRPEVMLEIPEGATVRDLLGRLAQVCGNGLDLMDPQTGGVRSFYRVLLGGRDYRCLEGRLETLLADGDQVALFPPVAGG